MILIADSGSTKTDWCVVENGVLLQQIFTKGTNPFFQSEEEISNEIATALLPQLKTSELDAVYFYGAGCGFPDKISMVHRAITKHLSVKNEVEVNTDMLAAARGLCGHDSGIACIMGTGSNSCYYDGKSIVTNVSPLGFILGDEGSGACLGKLLVGDILKNQMTPELKEKFLKQFDLTPADIIDRILICNIAFRQLFPTAVNVIFGILYRISQCSVTTGNQADNQRGGHTESRWNFRSVEYAQTSTGTRTHVEDASALFHAGHNLGYQLFYLRDCPLYGKRHFLVFGIDVFQNFTD